MDKLTRIWRIRMSLAMLERFRAAGEVRGQAIGTYIRNCAIAGLMADEAKASLAELLRQKLDAGKVEDNVMPRPDEDKVG